MSIWSEISETLWPSPGSRDGPLPPLLLILTLITGMVDAASFLMLGRVFVANMTGNVVFLGFALAGAKGLLIPASLVGIGAFLAGGIGGGLLGRRLGGHRGRLLRAALALQLALFFAAVVVATAGGGDPIEHARRYVLIALLAVAMGIQNATARRLAVPELTTTVLTMTLTGIAADSQLAGGKGAGLGRRVLAVGAMLAGACFGALIVLDVGTAVAIGTAGGILAFVLLCAHQISRSDDAWAR
jgi:uncharacterized membrane protein YoaK (UPF0700 family)